VCGIGLIMTRWLIIGGLIAFGLLLSFWPAISWGDFKTLIFPGLVLIVSGLALYLLFVRAWSPFLIALGFVYMGLCYLGTL
jgi:hypothetical protein